MWLGGWCGVDLPLLPSAAELIVAPWNDDGNTTQLVPAEYMKVATRNQITREGRLDHPELVDRDVLVRVAAGGFARGAAGDGRVVIFAAQIAGSSCDPTDRTAARFADGREVGRRSWLHARRSRRSRTVGGSQARFEALNWIRRAPLAGPSRSRGRVCSGALGLRA